MKNKLSFSSEPKNDEHYRQLKKLVKERIELLPAGPITLVRIRAIGLIMLYYLLYGAALIFAENMLAYYSFYTVMGIVIVLIFLNVIHEAVHGNLFKSRMANNLAVCFLDLIGANSYIFRKRHVNLHHHFANVDGWDSDIEQAYLVKIVPHVKQKPVHRVQHRTFGFLYPMYLVNWVFVRDFKDYFVKTRVVRKVSMDIPLSEYVKLFIFKSVFILYTIGVPLLFGVSLLHAVTAMLCMLVVAGSFALIILLTPHVNIKNQFPIPQDNKIRGGWFLHQLNTTNDLSCRNWVSRNVMANFNFHLSHHLFPHISYVYAPYVATVIKEYAMKYDLNYRSYSIPEALKYHYELLRENAALTELLEDDM